MTEVSQKKSMKELKKRSDICDKEVLALTGGLYPVALQNTKKLVPKNVRKWVKVALKINGVVGDCKYWIEEDRKDQPYSGLKYDLQIEIVQFNQEEYNDYLKDLDCSWNYEETKYLFELCQTFDCKFIVIVDRYDYPNVRRDISELKDRFYSVTSAILRSRKQFQNPFENYNFDLLYDQRRLYELEKYLKRDKQVQDGEKQLIEELKKIDVLIKKQEREANQLKKTIQIDIKDQRENEDEDPDYIINLNKQQKQKLETVQQSFAYLRSQWIAESLPISQKLQKKLDNGVKEIMQLQQGSRIVLNSETEDLFDKMRGSLLAVFSLQRQEKRREQV